MKIKNLPKYERPREKLIEKGATALKDKELLAILLGTGRAGKNVIEVAAEILEKHKMKKLLALSYSEMAQIKGIGPAKATAILAAFEITKRALAVEDNNLPTINSAKDAVAQLQELRTAKKEHFIVLYLNARNQLVYKETISVGTLNASLIHSREVFEPAVRNLAAQIIVAHNHPSGDREPSEDDLVITKRLVEAGKITGIEIVDHIIITKTGFINFKDKGLIG